MGSPDPSSPPEDESSAPDNRRPTPVREAMEAEREEVVEEGAPEMTFVRGEEVWIARVKGRGCTGRGRDPGAPLLLITFAPWEEPENQRFEALQVASRLADLTEAQLVEALEAARPYPGDWRRGDLFSATRRRDRRR